MNISELIEELTALVATGEVPPDAEVTAIMSGEHTTLVRHFDRPHPTPVSVSRYETIISSYDDRPTPPIRVLLDL
jgi:hypothetical protein